MKPLLFLALASLIARPGFADDPPKTAKPDKADKPDKPEVKIYDEKADARSLIATALVATKRENRRVLIQWGGNWCSWCVLLHNRFKSDPTLAKTLRYEYDVVHIDSKNKDLLEKYGVDLSTAGVPYLTVLDAEGKVVVNQPTEGFETKEGDKNGHDPKKLNEFLVKYKAEPQKAADVLAAALVDAAKTERKVFLHFGAPWCGWCHKLDDWLRRAEVAPIIAKDYIDLKIDQDRMTGAMDILEKYNPGKKGGIPWFVVLDSAGKVVVTSDGPKGNIGFPSQPHEIEYFVKMLDASRKRISEKDVDALKKSLTPPAKTTGEK
jgi:thiol-disulfide isomerase/thioredoxin